MSARNALVIAQPRTGSTLLISYIKLLLGLQDAGYELLNYNLGEEWTPRAIGKFEVKQRIDHSSLDGMIELNRRYDVLANAGWPTTKVVQDQWRMLGKHQRDEMIRNYDCVITLDRRDVIENIVSQTFAVEQNHWHRRLNDPPYHMQGGIKIHPGTINRWFRNYEEFKWLIKDMPRKPNAHFSYEQLNDRTQMQHLLGTHCGLPVDESIEYSLLKNVEKEKRARWVPNYQALVKKLEEKLKENPDVFLPRTGIEI